MNIKNRVKAFSKKTLRAFRDAVFPPRCFACNEFFPGRHEMQNRTDDSGQDVRIHLSPFLCDQCLSDVNMVESPICTRCGVMYRERESEDHLCGACIKKNGRVSMARASVVYEKSLMRLVHAFKYRGKVQLAKPLGRLLFSRYCEVYEKEPGLEPDLILPVPLHKRKFRKRGYNQAYLLLKEWPERLRSLCSDKTPVIVRNGLIKIKQTNSQAGLDKKERMSNIKGTFALSAKCDVKGKHVLVIDDVYTTGATAEECAGVLMAAGADRVDVLTFSRVM